MRRGVVASSFQPSSAAPLLSLYDSPNTVSAITSLAASLGVTVTGYAFYTDGSTWSSIGSWTVPGTIPAGKTLVLSVDLTPDSTGLSAVSSHIATFQTLATYLATLIGINIIIRLGWEMDIITGPWGNGVNGNTPSQYAPAAGAVISAMLAICPTLQFDFSCNTGTSDLAQLEVYFGSGIPYTFAGGDHYDTSSGSPNDFSAFAPVVHLAVNNGLPVSCGEWGLSGRDDPTFIANASQFFLDPAASAARYTLPTYTVGYQSYFNAINSVLSDYPTSKTAYTADFG